LALLLFWIENRELMMKKKFIDLDLSFWRWWVLFFLVYDASSLVGVLCL